MKQACKPSPCGANAYCREHDETAVCECWPDYRGNPYDACHPECLVNSDCPNSFACIHTKCQDPCPATCGINAICSVSSHVAICSCPYPSIGDAFTRCDAPIEKPSNPCNPSPCGPNTVCEVLGTKVICSCLPSLQGEPTSLSGCHPECVLSSDCPGDKACENSRCVSPCTVGICGSGADCRAINHSPVCSCPVNLIGNPFIRCFSKHEISPDPCHPSPCNPNGECKVRNDVAVCIYPECLINSDCSRDRACFSQRCRDPCIGACGINSICQTVNHRPICSCPAGYYGDSQIQCRITIDKPRPECTRNSECSNDRTCFEEICVNPCDLGSCGVNSRCQVLLHRAVCVCNEGFTGNPQQYCREIGCRGDDECALSQSCINQNCIDVCEVTQCGLNAICRSDGYHKSRCVCPEGFLGSPNHQCVHPECTSDIECASFLSCRNNKCTDPCNCAPSAQCNVFNHRAECRCPPGFIGDAYTSCTKKPELLPECSIDADCPSRLACFGGTCKDPCHESEPCITNAKCTVIDTLPMRTMICECLPDLIGDATVACAPIAQQVRVICHSDSECESNMACINSRCINPCTINPCASSAECQVVNHQHHCSCSKGFVGDGIFGCQKDNIPMPECTSNDDCSSSLACLNQKCQNPCSDDRCGLKANCLTIRHHPTCHCPHGMAGDPQNQCFERKYLPHFAFLT